MPKLSWGDIDLSVKTMTFVQRKTGASVQIPIHRDLYNYLLELPRSADPKGPVFPKLFDKPGAGKSGLSMSFKRLMQRADGQCGSSARDPPKVDRARQPRHEQALHAFGARDRAAGYRVDFAVAG